MTHQNFRSNLHTQRLPRLLQNVFADLGVAGAHSQHAMTHVDRLDVPLGLEIVEGQTEPNSRVGHVAMAPGLLVVIGRVLIQTDTHTHTHTHRERESQWGKRRRHTDTRVYLVRLFLLHDDAEQLPGARTRPVLI